MRIEFEYVVDNRIQIVITSGLYDHLPKVGGTVSIDGKSRTVREIIHQMKTSSDADLVKLSSIRIRLGAVHGRGDYR